MGKSYVTEVDIAGDCPNPRQFFLQCKTCGTLARITVGCGSRFSYFCDECSKRWRKKTFARYFKAVVAMKNPKFLTLTLKKQRGRLTDRLMMMWDMKKYLFKKLSRLGYKIPSWVGVIEPPNHIHLIIDSQYIPQRIISELWLSITNDSYIVDVRKVNGSDLSQVAAYITKYLTKASTWDGINLDMLKGFHLVGAWGLPKSSPRRPLCICGVPGFNRLDSEGFYVQYNFNEKVVAKLIKDNPLHLKPNG